MDSPKGRMFSLDDVPEVTPIFALGGESNDGIENDLNEVFYDTNGTYGASSVENEDSLSELDSEKFKSPKAKPVKPVFRR